MSKIIFESERCIGCGYCFSIAPNNFECNDEGRASMISDKITDEAIEASEGCPVSAILIEDNCNCDNCSCEHCECGNDCKCDNNCNCDDDCNCDDECNCDCKNK